jgi:diguanylate cyclase (GGDEF)-like protein/PAS domain S-box-containing protein
MYAFPDSFSHPIYGPIHPYFLPLAAVLITAAVALLYLAEHGSFRRASKEPSAPGEKGPRGTDRFLRRALALIPALLAVPLVVPFALSLVRGTAVGAIQYGILTVGVAAAGFLGWRPTMDLHAITLAAIQAGIALMALVAPGQIAGSRAPLLALTGALGAAALLLPEAMARRLRIPHGFRRWAPLALPLLLTADFAAARLWTGAISWSIWCLDLILGGVRLSGRRTEIQPDLEPEAALTARLEAIVEGWIWTLVLAVVILTALAGPGAVAPPFITSLFVVAVSAYNLLAHYVFSNRGTPERRLVWHTQAMTLALGLLLTMPGPLGHSFLVPLAALAPLATRAWGVGAGVRTALLAGAVQTLGTAVNWLTSDAALGVEIAHLSVELVTLGIVLYLGIRMDTEQRGTIVRLAAARSDLQAAQEELQAQNEELQAQQEELQHQNDRLNRSQQEQSRLVDILEATADYVGMSTLDGRRVYANQAARRLLGVASDYDLTGRPFMEVHPAWAREMIRDVAIPTTLESGFWRGESALLTPGGDEIPVSQTMVAHRNPDGTVAYLSTITRDIREEKRVEEELRRSEERFRNAFDHAPIGMALTDAGGQMLQVNQALCAMLGHAGSDLLGRRLEEIIHPDDAALVAGHYTETGAPAPGIFTLETRFSHRRGHTVWTQLSASVSSDAQGRPVSRIVQVQDITEWKRSEAQLLHLASFDPLTGLLNRRRFMEELDRQVLHAERNDGRVALLFLDLDEFKYINDTLGHEAGDVVIKSVADLLREQLRGHDTIARLGGDEFAICLSDSDEDGARTVADRLLTTLRSHQLTVAGQPVNTTASVGIAIYPESGRTGRDLLVRADLAMYVAKEQGRNRSNSATPGAGDQARMQSKLQWERRIRDALEQERFVLYRQPILDLRCNRVTKYELLLRMVGEEGQLIPPQAFLSVAEQFGQIRAIDRWVVTRAIHTLAEQGRAGEMADLGVNLSARAFDDDTLCALIGREMQATGVNPANLIFEITETAAIQDIDRARRFMERLRALGCRFAIDDFGTGFSSFYYVKQLPVDFLKIDGSFIRNLPRDPVDHHLVRAMVEVARGLGKETVAEFVEDEATLAWLREYGVDHAQGFYIGRPEPVVQEEAV